MPHHSFFFFFRSSGSNHTFNWFCSSGRKNFYAYDCDCNDIDIVQVRAFNFFFLLPLDPFAREPRL